MKIFKSLLFIVFIFIILAGCDSPVSNDDPVDNTKPELTILQGTQILENGATLDFGSVVVGSPDPVITITLRNDGDADLILKNVSMTNSYQFDVDRLFASDELSISPGTSFDLDVEFDVPYSYAGDYSTELTLSTNDDDERRTKLNFTARSMEEPEPEIAVEREGNNLYSGTTAYNFRTIDINEESLTDILTIINTGTADLIIESMSFDHSAYTVSGITFPCTIAPSEQQDFQVSCLATESGSINARLTIFNNDYSEEEFHLEFEGYASDTPAPVIAIEVDGVNYMENEDVFNFGPVMDNEGEKTVTVTIRNIGSADLEITDVELNSYYSTNYSIENISLPLSISPDGTFDFDLTFHPANDRFNGYLIIDSNDPGNSSHYFSFTGSAAEDTIPPSEVTDLQVAGIRENSILLTWTNPDEADHDRTIISYTPGTDNSKYISEYSDDVLIDDLDVNVTYTFTVQTRDNDGNVSDGVQISATTDWQYQDTYTGPGDAFYHVDLGSRSGTKTINYNLDLGDAVKDVYFVFTNDRTISNVIADTPVVTDYSGSELYAPSYNRIPSYGNNGFDLPENEPLIRDNPDVVDFYNNMPETIKGPLRNTLSGPSPEPNFDIVLDTHTFMYDSTENLIPATCRSVETVDGITLNIWVANDCWTGAGVKSNEITQTMVDEISNAFLKSGSDNDIYEWVTNIFGIEWGSHVYTNLISDDDEITILIYDIDNDDATDGGVVGFFYAKDNYTTSTVDFSNERIMFYLDAVLLGQASGGSWEITDFWPSALVSTLAHEFQHMIHFYQKRILNNNSSNSETWLNEMMSLAAEDLVSSKIGDNGPRGVDYSDGSAGSPLNGNGHLPLYNYTNNAPVAIWLDEDPMVSYSVNYSFGAYLLRNYGGAQLARDIVQNTYNDEFAITYALSENGYSENFADVLRKWGVANLLSDNTSAPVSYRYNVGTWFESTLGSITYYLGSINLYNYTFGGEQGPRIVEDLSSVPGQYMSSNLYYRVGNDLTGDITRTITLHRYLELTVVVKED